MKQLICLLALVMVLGIATRAQDDAYSAIMKQVGPAAQSLNKNLMAKSADSVADARKLQALMGQTHDYWQKKSVADATKFAADAQSGFKDVADQAMAGKYDDAAATLKMTQNNCQGCHMAHRVRNPDGTFTMK